MHKVKVYDDTGKLKEVISVQALKKRSDKLIETPSLYRKTRESSGSQLLQNKNFSKAVK